MLQSFQFQGASPPDALTGGSAPRSRGGLSLQTPIIGYQCRPISDGCIYLLTACAIFRHSWHIDSNFWVFFRRAVASKLSASASASPLTRGSASGPRWRPPKVKPQL